MRRLAVLLPVTLLLLGYPAPAASQDSPPQMFYLVQEFVKPSKIAEYEANTKAFLKDLAMTPGAKETIQFSAVSGPEVGYIYVVPVDGWAGLGKAFGDWDAASRAMGQQKWAEHMARSTGLSDHSATSVMMMRPDLSYRAETAALTADRRYRHYDWWYIMPGHEQDIEAIAKEYIALYRAKNIQRGWRIYQSVVSPDLPMYLVVQTGTDEASYYAEDARIRQMLGSEGERLQQKAMQFTRRVESNYSWIRPDLSFPMAEQQVGSR